MATHATRDVGWRRLIQCLVFVSVFVSRVDGQSPFTIDMNVELSNNGPNEIVLHQVKRDTKSPNRLWAGLFLVLAERVQYICPVNRPPSQQNPENHPHARGGGGLIRSDSLMKSCVI
jgi:hypothetical protein